MMRTPLKYPIVENGAMIDAPTTSWTDNTDSTWLGDYDNTSAWVISDAADLAAFASAVNSGKSFEGKTVLLTENINLNSHIWTPIGEYEYYNNGDNIIDHRFNGTFDGCGHTVSGIYFNDGAAGKVGLFGSVGADSAAASKSVIKNVSVINSYIFGSNDVGGIVGSNRGGLVQNCYNSATVASHDGTSTNSWSVGGIAGINEGGIIRNCYNTGSISGDTYVGGVVGENFGGNVGNATIENCYNIGTVKGNSGLGGISGQNQNYEDFYVKYSYALTGAVEGATQAFSDNAEHKGVLTGTHTNDNYFVNCGIFSDNSGALTLADDALGDNENDTLTAPALLSALNKWVENNSSAGAYTWEVKSGQNSGYPILVIKAPSITSGANQELPASSDNSITVTSDADFAAFRRVEVGKQGETPAPLGTENYTAAKGSTIITLKNSYLKTLSEGTYTLNIVSASGTASTTFTIKASGGNSGGSSAAYCTITATAGIGGDISTGKYVYVPAGDSAGFTFTPDKGYVIADVKVDGKSVGTADNYVFTNVFSDHTITVAFAKSAKPTGDGLTEKDDDSNIDTDVEVKPSESPKPIPTPEVTQSDSSETSACGLCGFCTAPFGICIFIWLIVIAAAAAAVIYFVKRKKE